MENDEEEIPEEDPVPFICERHFAEAMKTAKASVSEAELRRYEAYRVKYSTSSIAPSSNFGTAAASSATASSGTAAFNEEAGADEDDDLY
ncbi:hypothetical protein HANVADRAFT_53974, partial [Hanseniaspora valbyensis NRRL Y-1626]